MSNASLNKVRAEALTLSDDQRAELAHDLIASLDAPLDPDAADAWDAEITRRLAQIEAGTAKLINRHEFRRRIRQRIGDD